MGLRRKPARSAVRGAHRSLRFSDRTDGRSEAGQPGAPLMGNVVLRADALSKRYTIKAGQLSYRTLRDDLTAFFTRPFRGPHRAAVADTEFWALQDVSLQIEPGKVAGVLGR